MVYHRSEGASAPPKRDAATSQYNPVPAQNAFRNDGSFLEMFKKMQEANAGGSSAQSGVSKEPVPHATPSSPSTPAAPSSSRNEDLKTAGLSTASSVSGNTSSGDEGPKEGVKRAPLVGKRRGGRILPTGVVKKKRADEEETEEKPKDAWSLYMAEVKRYKDSSCEEDGKTRPLVK